MKAKQYILLAFLLHATWLGATDYNASLFGAVSDGETNNTGSFQKAIDFIAAQGGGTLNLYVGRYLTGTLHMKSNVTLRLHEGAVLVASTAPYDYDATGAKPALIRADSATSVTIIGKGIIEGNGTETARKLDLQRSRNLLTKEEDHAPALIGMNNCTDVTIEGITLQNPCGDILTADHSNRIAFTGLTLKSSRQSRGFVVEQCNGTTITNCYVETSGAPFTRTHSKEIRVKNCVNQNGKQIN